MKRTLILLVIILAAQNLYAARPKADTLLLLLDYTLDVRDKYEHSKQRTIDQVRKMRTKTLSDAEEYSVNKQLIELYRPYIYDSAVYYVMLNRELAEKADDRRMIDESKIDYSNILRVGGMYKEAIDNLNTIDRGTISPPLLADYYLCYEQTYHHQAIYAAGTIFESEYRGVSAAYVDSLRLVVPENSDKYFALSRIIASSPNKRLAIARLQDLLEPMELGSHGYAIVSSTLADCYDASDPSERQIRKHYLILSAISDISSTVKEYVSLSDLSSLLYAEGDLARAYRYGAISMEDANFYNARLRRIEMSQVYPIIERAYKIELDKKNKRLQHSIIMISILVILMLGLIIFVMRQTFLRRRIRLALIKANEKLGETNRSLKESNRVKEEYLGRFLSMCSSYINRLERYQSTINSKLNAGKVEEVRIMTRSSSLIDHEIAEFYRSFDKAFLRLYPNFINDFNALLRDDERIEVRSGEFLATEMRIYALVRLGISDAASIAKFLRYSANTVYTYRHKVRSKAKDKDTFEEKLLNIGF